MLQRRFIYSCLSLSNRRELEGVGQRGWESICFLRRLSSVLRRFLEGKTASKKPPKTFWEPIFLLRRCRNPPLSMLTSICTSSIQACEAKSRPWCSAELRPKHRPWSPLLSKLHTVRFNIIAYTEKVWKHLLDIMVKTFISCYRTPGPQKGFRRGLWRVLEGF